MIHNFKLKIKTLILQNLDKSSKIWQKMLKNLAQKFTDESFAKYILHDFEPKISTISD